MPDEMDENGTGLLRTKLKAVSCWAFFDLEAQHSAAEVGGFQHMNRMGISVAVAWEWPCQVFHVFESHQTKDFGRLLRSVDRLVGYNIHHFDIPILKASKCRIPARLQIVDLLIEIERQCGRRFSLDSMLKANFGVGQGNAEPLHNIRLWKERRLVELAANCINDVVGMQRLFGKLQDGSPLKHP